jgi:hypothetical protein
MDFRQAPRGRVLVAQASTGDLVAGEGGATKLRYWPGCAAGPKETVVSPASATAAMVLMLPGVYAVPTHFYLTLDQPRSNQHRSNPATPEVVALSC